MSVPTSPPAWHPDPTGAHELRYWDGTRWTEHVSDGGVQSVAPLQSVKPASSATPGVAAETDNEPKRRRGKAAWVIGGLALLAVAAVVIALMSGSSDDGNTADSGGDGGVDSGQSFCDDFSGSWSIVMAGMIAAETLMYDAGTNPSFAAADTDTLNSVTQAAQDAGVIAAEAPDDLKDQISKMSDFLGLAIQLAQGDASVVDDMTSLGISSEDTAYLLGSVPVSTCTGA